MRFQSIAEIFDFLPEDESVILDVLREIVKSKLPEHCKEKISYNVPYFYGKKGICIIWPASIPRGGISEGVLFGFWQGNLLKDEEDYLTKGTNKKIFYKIFTKVEEIEVHKIERLLDEAIALDITF